LDRWKPGGLLLLPAHRLKFPGLLLVHKRTPNPRKLPYIVGPPLLESFRRLVDQTGADVVPSSTWRYDPTGLFSSKHWGIPFIDVIPDIPGRPRRDEVLAWLKTREGVRRFAVLDDEDDELDELPLFQPSASTGIDEKIAEGMAPYLLEKTDKDMRCNPMERFFAKHSVNDARTPRMISRFVVRFATRLLPQRRKGPPVAGRKNARGTWAARRKRTGIRTFSSGLPEAAFRGFNSDVRRLRTRNRAGVFVSPRLLQSADSQHFMTEDTSALTSYRMREIRLWLRMSLPRCSNA
jgi:HAD domain in Swiss Army Knife RNA repair proteins